MSTPDDDRVKCTDCRHCAPDAFRCRKLQKGELIALPRRCTHFAPFAGNPDQRGGAERWPGLENSITKARAEDAAHREAHG